MTGRSATLALTMPGPIRLYSTDELLKLQPPQWLVQRVLPAGGFIGMYGDSYTGKSYLAIDLALCVASGIPWHGHEVRKGFVVYIVAEGGHGVRKRAQAWCTLNRMRPSKPDIGWLLQSIPLHPSSEEMDMLCRRLIDELDTNPALIVIDTLARCFPLAGDENTQEDMGQFVAGVDRLRTEFKSAVMAIHHTRVANDRERGSTAFRGAADTMILVTKPQPEHVQLKCTKQKDFDEFEPIMLRFTKVNGETPDLNSAAFSNPLTAQDLIRMALSDGLAHTPRELLEVYHRTPHTLPRSTLMRALRDTVQKGEIIKEKDTYRLKNP